MNLKNIGNNMAILFGVFLIYLSAIIMLESFSISRADFSTTYIQGAHAKLNFYQDKFGTQNYNSSGSSFWSSPEYYNASFDTVNVTHGQEVEDLPVGISEVITRITRSSH